VGPHLALELIDDNLQRVGDPQVGEMPEEHDSGSTSLRTKEFAQSSFSWNSGSVLKSQIIGLPFW
jgi:hypothetical protein